MVLWRRRLLLAAAGLTVAARGRAEGAPIRFAVGPFQPTAGDTRRAFEPFFAYLADAIGRPFELTVTTDWAGIAVALATDQVDSAWMGAWGYVLAKDRAGAEALAVVDYEGKPFYHAVIIAPPDADYPDFPKDARGRSISFGESGSTSGWLIPSYWFKTQGIDPKSWFKYRDGASHPANDIAVANGQVDLATDYDRNITAMVDAGRIKADQVKVVWRSEPLPNDALAVRRGLDQGVKEQLLEAALKIDPALAKSVLPPHYTGWERVTPATYAVIETAGRALGRIGGE